MRKLLNFILTLGRKNKKPTKEITWRCRRCKETVDMKNKKCGCTISPSPWEIEF